jgi:hypothetical protein
MPVATAHHHHFCFVFFRSRRLLPLAPARRGVVITNPAMDELLGIGYCHLFATATATAGWLEDCWLAGWWLFGC